MTQDTHDSIEPMATTPPAAKALSWYLRRRIAPAVALGLLLVLGYFGFWRYHLKRFHAVHEGALYRAAQPTEFGFQHLREKHGVRTILNVRLEDPQLYNGLFDPFEPSGMLESQCVPQQGMQLLQWPMGEEKYWPWLTPWQFEEFFRLFDNPDNLPVMVHCLGGRHRTGTFSALYQLEYLRLPADQVIEEMLSFEFGPQPQVQNHNLRTYWPRPRPDASQWKRLAAAICGEKSANRAADYEQLVRQIRQGGADSPLAARLAAAIEADIPFALCLAQRVLQSPDEPLAETAASHTMRCLDEAQADHATLASAAAIVADYGAPEQQQKLLGLLESESTTEEVSPRYHAMVVGVTNRFTPNRIAFLLPLLADKRTRSDATAPKYRYCDTAVAHLVSITNKPLYLEVDPLPEAWDLAVGRAQDWFETHPDGTRLAQLLPPTGKNAVKDFRGKEIDGQNFVR